MTATTLNNTLAPYQANRRSRGCGTVNILADLSIRASKVMCQVRRV
jgi:hypothetical protein